MDAAEPNKDNAVTILIRQKRFHGTYEIDGHFITVRSLNGEMRAQLGIQDARKLARKLLRMICVRADIPAPQVRAAAAE